MLENKRFKDLKEEAKYLNPTGQLGIRQLEDGSQQLYYIESVVGKRGGRIANIIPLTRIVTDAEGYILADESYRKTIETETKATAVVDTRKREIILLADVDILLDVGKSNGLV